MARVIEDCEISALYVIEMHAGRQLQPISTPSVRSPIYLNSAVS